MTLKDVVSYLRVFDMSNHVTHSVICMAVLVNELLLCGFLVSYGWNKFLVDVFGATISFPQAIAIVVAGKALTIGNMPASDTFIDRKLTRITHLICAFVFLYVVQV